MTAATSSPTPGRSAASSTATPTPTRAPGGFRGITYACSGWIVAYTRDSAGQITAVTTTQPGHGATNLATSVTHMPFGPSPPDLGQWRDRRPHLRSRLPDDQHHRSRHGNIQYLSYGYDADNNVHTITDNVTPGEQPDAHLGCDRPADRRDRLLRRRERRL